MRRDRSSTNAKPAGGRRRRSGKHPEPKDASRPWPSGRARSSSANVCTEDRRDFLSSLETSKGLSERRRMPSRRSEMSSEQNQRGPAAAAWGRRASVELRNRGIEDRREEKRRRGRRRERSCFILAIRSRGQAITRTALGKALIGLLRLVGLRPNN